MTLDRAGMAMVIATTVFSRVKETHVSRQVIENIDQTNRDDAMHSKIFDLNLKQSWD